MDLFCSYQKNKSTAFSLLIIVYVSVRNDPLGYKGSDFQSTPYILLSIFNGVYFLVNATNLVFSKNIFFRKVIVSIILMIIVIFSFAFYRFTINNWWSTYRQKLTGGQPIYQSHPIAPYLNPLLTKDDYFFIGPYDPESNFYTKAKPASKYYYLMPAMDGSLEVSSELVKNIDRSKPKIIIYHTEYNVLGREPGKDFVKHLLVKDYVTLESLKNQGFSYTVKLKWLGSFRYDLERHIFIRRDSSEQVLRKMEELGYIKIKA